jgi:hypothetical protein
MEKLTTLDQLIFYSGTQRERLKTDKLTVVDTAILNVMLIAGVPSSQRKGRKPSADVIR